MSRENRLRGDCDAQGAIMWTPEFTDALETVRRMSRDSRIVVFALLTFSLASLIMLLNGYDDGWTKQRIATVKSALIQDCGGSFNDSTLKLDMKSGASGWTAAYAHDRRFLNCADLYSQYETLRDMYNEDILMIRVPVVGMRVDANWLAILSSIGLALLLGGLVTAFRRESRALHFADSEDILRRARMENFFSEWIALCVIWFPVLVAVLVYREDWATVGRGLDINRALSRTTSVIGGLAVLGCLMLACIATGELRRLVKTRGRDR